MRLSLFALFDRRRTPAPDPAAVGWLKGAVYAHRGVHGAGVEENSTGAFAGAIERGLGIECDVRLSRDGRAIVFHDATLDRLTGREGRLDRLGVAAPMVERGVPQLAPVQRHPLHADAQPAQEAERDEDAEARRHRAPERADEEARGGPREAVGSVAGDDAGGSNLARQQRFFAAHLQPWVAQCCEGLQRHPQARFYAALARFTHAFMTVEAQAFDMLDGG